MRNSNYITLFGWMFNDLGLKGNEVIVFGLIYGFSQDEKSKFSGSLSYISKTTNLTRKTVINTLKKLVDKGLVVKDSKVVDNMVVNLYSVGSVKNTLVGSVKNSVGSVKITPEGSVKITPNNTSINNTNIYTAVDFLNEHHKQKFDVWMCNNKSSITDWQGFVNHFNNKVVLESIDFEASKLIARLNILKSNWKNASFSGATDVQISSQPALKRL